VGISVEVYEYTGRLVAQSTGGCDVVAVCRAASDHPARYPLLAGVDELDDTTFNARQSVVLIAELTRLAAATDVPDLRDAATELITLAELLVPAPRRPHHRRLVFNGD